MATLPEECMNEKQQQKKSSRLQEKNESISNHYAGREGGKKAKRHEIHLCVW